jgi:hypothetical protein
MVEEVLTKRPVTKITNDNVPPSNVPPEEYTKVAQGDVVEEKQTGGYSKELNRCRVIGTKLGDPIGELLCLVIVGLESVIDAFVTVLSDTAQTIAELTILGGIIYGSLRLFGGAFRSLRAITGLRA